MRGVPRVTERGDARPHSLSPERVIDADVGMSFHNVKEHRAPQGRLARSHDSRFSDPRAGIGSLQRFDRDG
jgi:hypothetical protein